jgi:hypothetical protein
MQDGLRAGLRHGHAKQLLLYQCVHLNQFDDGGSSIGGTSTNALRGRIGFRLFRANLSNDRNCLADTGGIVRPCPSFWADAAGIPDAIRLRFARPPSNFPGSGQTRGGSRFEPRSESIQSEAT